MNEDEVISFNGTFNKTQQLGGAWVAQLVKRLTLAQVMISGFLSLSPSSVAVLTAQSLEPASDGGGLPLSLPLPHSHSVCLSLSKK